MASSSQCPRRYVRQQDAAVWCPTGRWGPRRVCVTECLVLLAEDLYTRLLADSPRQIWPGQSGQVTWRMGEREVTAAWTIRANSVWRFGRVFFLCPKCGARVARLYLPLPASSIACRTCWGLSYESRQVRNYKGIATPLSARWRARLLTRCDQDRRLEAAAIRHRERRRVPRVPT
jgi:hypothetical protein